MFSPDGGFEFEEFLWGLDDPGVVAGQDAGAQEETNIPVALQLVQAAFFTQEAAQLHSWKTTRQMIRYFIMGGRFFVLSRFPLGYCQQEFRQTTLQKELRALSHSNLRWYVTRRRALLFPSIFCKRWKVIAIMVLASAEGSCCYIFCCRQQPFWRGRWELWG